MEVSTKMAQSREFAQAEAWQSNKQIPVKIVNAETFEPRFASTFSIGYMSRNEWILTIATVVPPPALTAEEWEAIQVVEATTAGRYVLTLPHAEELIDLLAQMFNQTVGQEVYRKVGQEQGARLRSPSYGVGTGLAVVRKCYRQAVS